ncbi:caspase-1-like protein [Leptotrombidium deliense]|uniref:Caspase-1-like protein n=1 Tax=Leptotrombidium deliense TaxID=299467 RepID=A0A443SFN3_9ACAR|nr:caspase-1-like protein [Leptotrombidium deliense]
MGFNVVSFDGLTVDEIRRVITYLAAEDYSNSDCFVCVVLTNGRKNIVMAKDGAYSIDLLYASFEKNESLRGKPKMFFVQADCEHPNDSLSNLPLQHHLHAKVPVVPDFLVVVSSPNELRCSSINCRSLFLETLVYCFEKYLRTDDLLSVLTIVNGMLEVSNLGSMRKDHTLSITIHRFTTLYLVVTIFRVNVKRSFLDR